MSNNSQLPILVMHKICSSCSLNHYKVIASCYNDEEAALEIFRNHQVIPRTRDCPMCGEQCSYRKEERIFICNRKFKDPILQSYKICKFQASEFSDTFLAKSQIPIGRILIFCSLFQHNTFKYAQIESEMGFSSDTIVTWNSLCLEVCQNWLENQKALGGPDTVVEIAALSFKLYKSSTDVDLWILGGFERYSKQKFALPLQEVTADTVIPIIQKYVLPGTLIYTDELESYSKLSELGYTHQVVHPNEDHISTGINTLKIKKVLKDIAYLASRRGNKKHYNQYYARFFFQALHPHHDSCLHHFLLQIKDLYPPPPEAAETVIQVPINEEALDITIKEEPLFFQESPASPKVKLEPKDEFLESVHAMQGLMDSSELKKESEIKVEPKMESAENIFVTEGMMDFPKLENGSEQSSPSEMAWR